MVLTHSEVHPQFDGQFPDGRHVHTRCGNRRQFNSRELIHRPFDEVEHGWIGLGAVWLLALVVARWDLGIDWAVGRRWSRLRRRAGLPDGYCEGMSTDDLYREAQTQYLRGNYLQAETMLCHLTDRLGGDVDAQLMLATLYRHTGRLEEAAERLRRLELLEDAGKWQQEIQGEWASLRRVREESAVVESDGVTAAASVARP